jgi:Uroporphyrinogen decarboxylase (URO-D).
MNERERLMAVLRGDKPDRSPWFGDLSYLYSSMEIDGKLEVKYKGDEGYLRFYQDLGVGICFYPPFLWKTESTGGVQYQEKEENGQRLCEYITHVGNIRSVQKYLQNTYTWAYTEHFVKTIEDLRVMLYIFENTKYIENYDEFKKIDELWGELGIPAGIAPISVSPIQKLLARWAGVENTINIYMDDMDEFEEIILKIQDTEDEVFEILKRSPAQYIEFAENLSSEITGKNFFEKYNMPYYKKRIKQLHDSGKYVGIHIDGTLGSCLPLLEPCGFDVAEAVTPSPIGDIDVEDLRKVAGNNIVIWGGLPGALFSPQYPEQEFEEHLKKVMDTFTVGSKFVLGVADQVPPDGLISRVRKVREMIEVRG